MTNKQAMDYATVAIYKLYKGKILDIELEQLIHELRIEMYLSFDLLTEKEAEKAADKIKRK